MKKKSKKSTAKRLLEFTGRWAGEPPAEEAANYGNTGPVKKKRSWNRWAIVGKIDKDCWDIFIHKSTATAHRRYSYDVKKFEIKKVRVTEV